MGKNSMSKTKPFALNLAPEVLSQIEELAQKDKRTKTDILREAINRYIEDRRWKELREYGARQAAKLGIREKDVERVREEYWEERRREISGR